MRGLDFSSWSALLSTVVGLAVVTLLMVGIRLLVMETVQQRRQRENRQINERLRTLIAAYKTLGGSFTGTLAVDPTHLRDVLRAAEPGAAPAPGASDRSRRIRDAVEAALSDIILLGTEEQVRLAVQAAADLVAGRPVRTDALVVSLRDFIRQVLDLDPVPAALAVPPQGPARPGGSGASAGRGRSGGGGGSGQGQKEGAGSAGGGAGGGGSGGGEGLGLGLGQSAAHPDEPGGAPAP